MIVRNADPQTDAAACAAIYRPYVSDSAASFETTPPTAEEMASRIVAAYAWVLAEHEGVTLGYAYSSPHRERAAYHWAADVTVYVHANHQQQGIGRALYTQLFEQLRAIGLWTLCAGVTQPNDASNALHRRMGFTPVGTYRRIGWKAGAWHDVQWLQLDLRPDEPGPPDELGAETIRDSGGGIDTGSCDRDSGPGGLGFGRPALDLRTNRLTYPSCARHLRPLDVSVRRPYSEPHA